MPRRHYLCTALISGDHEIFREVSWLRLPTITGWIEQ